MREEGGINEITPDYVGRTLRIEFRESETSVDQLANRLRKIGFAPLEPAKDEAPTTAAISGWVLAGGVLLAIATAVWLLETITELSPPYWLAPALAVTSAGLSGWSVISAAVRSVRMGRLDMNALMSIAAIGAIAIGEWFEAATAMLLFGVALWLETLSLQRANRAVESLVKLTPMTFHRIINEAGETESAPIDALHVNDRFLVKPGERFPTDGDVLSGSSAVNQAPITGESMPVEKSPGDEVFAGSLNGEAALTVQATSAAGESTLAHIGRLISQATSAKSPTENFIDRFAGWYTPAVLALATLLVLMGPTVVWSMTGEFSGAVFVDWLHRALVLLVIACPCALVISTPLTFVCGLQNGASQGILIKGGKHLETAARVTAVAFDKTGTLTEGRPQVAKVKLADDATEQQLVSIAAALESHSEHPLAAAVLNYAREQQIEPASASDIRAMTGFGVQGEIAGAMWYVAKPRFFLEREFASPFSIDESIGDSATTVAWVGCDDRVIGSISFADQPRATAATAVTQLNEIGVKKVIMLTGDSGPVAARVGHNVGVVDVMAELLPAEKVAHVNRLASEQTVAMVGDGVNDAPALAAASLGIAMGTDGSDTAMETADVVILSQHLTRVPELVRLGRRTIAILWQNIALAIGLKLLVLLLASFGLASMWMAVGADVGASLLVIINGMRLLRNS